MKIRRVIRSGHYAIAAIIIIAAGWRLAAIIDSGRHAAATSPRGCRLAGMMILLLLPPPWLAAALVYDTLEIHRLPPLVITGHYVTPQDITVG